MEMEISSHNIGKYLLCLIKIIRTLIPEMVRKYPGLKGAPLGYL